MKLKNTLTARIMWSAALVALFILLLNAAHSQEQCFCIGEQNPCSDYHSLSLVRYEDGCHCGCVSMGMIVQQYTALIVVPFSSLLSGKESTRELHAAGEWMGGERYERRASPSSICCGEAAELRL
jgi:hypothetical protein